MGISEEVRENYFRKMAKADELDREATGYAWESQATEDEEDRQRLADIANTGYHRASLQREEAAELLGKEVNLQQ